MESLGFCVDSRRAKDGGLGHKSGLGVNGWAGQNRVSSSPGACLCPAHHVSCETSASTSASATGGARAASPLDGMFLERTCNPPCTGLSPPLKFLVAALTAQHGCR